MRSTFTKPPGLTRPISSRSVRRATDIDGIKTGDAFWLLPDLAFFFLRTDSHIAGVLDTLSTHRPMSLNGWSVTIKVPRGLGARIFEVASASRPGVGWQSGVITIPQC